MLVDPEVVAGIGAVYSDEILWEAGLRHDRASQELSSQEIRRLYRALVETLHEAVKHRGTSLESTPFVDLYGKPGAYQDELKVYGRDGEPCRRCRAPVLKARFANKPALVLRVLPGLREREGARTGRAGRLASGPGCSSRSLTLKGFKSFAETTTLDLEPGVTVVVGPNGSGKSNVVDAIGWVLGAQAPSAVRSQKMDDVIFAGTAKRPALGRAEVSLTIDNSAGLLPIEFSEVTLTRTLFRTGESDYAINGVPCRLLDIQELLSDTGVGRQQHVIVSQGQIDAVLNAHPEDRRLILEEAAGVLKFRKRKEKAERRLAATEGNLTRLQDLLREVRRQLRPLERQADAARRHGDVVAELRALQVFLAGRQLTTLHRRLADTTATRAEQADETDRLRRRLTELDTGVLAAEADLGRTGGDDVGAALSRFESLREKAKGLAAVLNERRRGIERERGAFVDQAVVASLEADAARLAGDLASCEAERVALEPQAADAGRGRSRPRRGADDLRGGVERRC